MKARAVRVRRKKNEINIVEQKENAVLFLRPFPMHVKSSFKSKCAAHRISMLEAVAEFMRDVNAEDSTLLADYSKRSKERRELEAGKNKAFFRRR